MNDARLIGLAYVAVQFHSGMHSRGYRLLSKIRRSPRTDWAARLLPKEEWFEARLWAAHYLRYARRYPSAF